MSMSSRVDLSASLSYRGLPGPYDRVLLSGTKYTILRRLDRGRHSRTYLAKCESGLEKERYVALKVLLRRDATSNWESVMMRELEMMRAIRDSGDTDALPRLIEAFCTSENGQSDRLWMAMPLLGPDIGFYRRSYPSRSLSLRLTKRVVYYVIDAIAELHRLGIVHTDVRPDNILLRSHASAEEISGWLEKQSTLPDQNQTCHLPIPQDLKWDRAPEATDGIKVTLAGLGQAQWVHTPSNTDYLGTFSLRAPESILQSEFGPEVDIWAIGCLVFEMLVGMWLFHPVEGDEWSLEDDHLAKMMEITGQTFSANMISRAARGSKYFNKRGDLRRLSDTSPGFTIEDSLARYSTLRPDEVHPAAEFIRTCIRLDPRHRPTALQLAKNPWLDATNPN